jgi:serine/threonine-protein kinase
MVAAMSNGTSEQDGELHPGDVCDGYRIASLIAAGGMGDVYEAVHLPSGKTVALKCMKLRHRDKEDARSRMKMEAVVLAELRHANLVKVYDAGVTEAGAIWLAMERLHGQTLRDLLRSVGRLSIPDALHYASEVADGVGAVHDANVVHRDIKPENIFITDKKLVKVLDLGTGKFTGYGLKSTDGTHVVGTTAYMAPEQIKGMRVDRRADVYALGLIVYEMIAGRHPLAGSSGLPRAIEQVALLQLQAKPRPISEVMADCPAYLSAVIEKAISKDRDQRQVSMTAFSVELRAARKRFIAEHRFDESSVDLRAAGDELRQKLGAPPRRTPTPPAETPLDFAKTEVGGPPDFTIDGSSQRGSATGSSSDPRTEQSISGREPTLELSMSSMGAPLPRDVPPSISSRASGRSVGAALLPTRTNPLGVGRVVLGVGRVVDLTPEPLSLPDGRSARRGILGRHLGLTLLLGAIIGVPPAVFGVYFWNTHRQAISAEPRVSESPTTATPPDPPKSTATDPLATTPANPPATTTEPAATAPPQPIPLTAEPASSPPSATPPVPPSTLAVAPRSPRRRAPAPSFTAAPMLPTPRALPSSGL